MSDSQYAGLCLNLIIGFGTVSFQIILAANKIAKAIDRKEKEGK